MFNPLGALFSTTAGAVKGMVEGVEEGAKTGHTGSIFDVVTVPVGAVAGAVTGTTTGAVVGLGTSVVNDMETLIKHKPIEWNPIKCAENTCDRMDQTSWCEDIVRPVTQVTNAVAVGAAVGALASTGVGAVAGTLTVAAVATSAGTGALTGVLREVDNQRARR